MKWSDTKASSKAEIICQKALKCEGDETYDSSLTGKFLTRLGKGIIITKVLEVKNILEYLSNFLRVVVPKILRTPHMAIRLITMRETRFNSSVKKATQIITPSIKFKPSVNVRMVNVPGRRKSQTGTVWMEITSR